MRREGRMHGAYVRESKHSDWPPVKAPTKPTNHSRCTGKCLSNKVRCTGCAFALPISKSKDKTKGRLKARSFNITSNYKMQEWRVCDSSPPSSSKKPILKVEKPAAWNHYADLDYTNDSDTEENSDSGNEIEEEEPKFWNSRIVLPIGALLQVRRMAEVLPEHVTDASEESITDYEDNWSNVDVPDCDEPGYDEDVSDGEESWADDWSLVEETL